MMGVVECWPEGNRSVVFRVNLSAQEAADRGLVLPPQHDRWQRVDPPEHAARYPWLSIEPDPPPP
jgi:hypothetical protein